MSESQNINDVVIEEITISKNGNLIKVFPNPQENNKIFVFHGIKFIESIFSNTIKGSLLVRDVGETLEVSNMVGKEIIKIRAYTPGGDASPINENAKINCEFIIYDIKRHTDHKTIAISDAADKATIYEFLFCSPEYFYLQEKKDYIETDYIGPISGTPSSFVEYVLSKFSELKSKLGYGGDNTNINIIEPTGNSLWIKIKNMMYPWSKDRDRQNIFSLLNYISNYSIGKENPNNVSYLFYNTKRGYNFRSIEDMILKGRDNDFTINENELGGKYKYMITNGLQNTQYIQTMTILQTTDHVDLFGSGGYSSFYEKVYPNFTDPYFDQIDFNSSHVKMIIDHNYHRDFDKWQHVEKYKLIPESIETGLENATQITDDIYGYYGKHFYDPDNKFMVDYDYISDTDGRPENRYWQNMFDISSLDASTAKIIKKNIKDKIITNKQIYTNLRNLKNKFDTYECSICCLTGQPADPCGPTGEYGIVAAGSFTDVVNYDKDGVFVESEGSGATLNYYPAYNFQIDPSLQETLKDYYYLKDSVPNFEKYVIDLEIEKLKLLINYHTQKLTACETGSCNGKFDYNNPDAPETSIIGQTTCSEISCCECSSAFPLLGATQRIGQQELNRKYSITNDVKIAGKQEKIIKIGTSAFDLVRKQIINKQTEIFLDELGENSP